MKKTFAAFVLILSLFCCMCWNVIHADDSVNEPIDDTVTEQLNTDTAKHESMWQRQRSNVDLYDPFEGLYIEDAHPYADSKDEEAFNQLTEAEQRLWQRTHVPSEPAMTIDVNDLGGTAGKLYIPAQSFCVNLNDSTPDNCQYIVNCENSAAVLDYAFCPNIVIADHWNQGFEAIKSCSIGDECMLVRNGVVYTYECVKVDPAGHNVGNDVYDGNGASIYEYGTNYLSMYTCNDNWHNVTVVVWVVKDAATGAFPRKG